MWNFDLVVGEPAVFPCGVTHDSSLDEYSKIQVQLIDVDEQLIEMLTLVTAK